MEQVRAKPTTTERLRQIAANHPDLCPGYVAPDGVCYRVVHLKGFSGLPQYLAQYEGAVIEWLPGHDGDEDCNSSLYRDEESFGQVFANIDILATKV